MTYAAPFRDRADAGRQLAKVLAAYSGRRDVRVLALPRGGVPVAYEVARALRAPLDVFVVRKLGVPGHEEYAIGAIASGGVSVIDEALTRRLGISADDVARVVERERAELERRERQYRGDRPSMPDVAGATVLLVDDGLATGSTMRAAVTALRAEHAREVVVAVPIGAPDTCDMLRGVADAVVCAVTPEPFHAVGLWYEDFEQTSDREVRDLLQRAARELPVDSGARPRQPAASERRL